ncbi:MAG TPA: aldehyde dehydrogenase family protein [Vicinamibacterales bacterium]|jgi:NADP-dependent aldehyde dehydrogenase|nr:aldehyde dehydrogenase family protein [Vicinamibacterales bacterium]
MPAVRTLAHDHWKNLIAGEPVDATDATYTARGALAHFEEASSAHVDRALEAATQAVDPDRGLPPDARAAFVERIAAEIEASDELIKAAHVETALPTQRLAGERGRTAGQLRMFAALVREGSWVDVRIDRALPQRTPLSKPDVRRMLIPIGPVAVFGAPYPPLRRTRARHRSAPRRSIGSHGRSPIRTVRSRCCPLNCRMEIRGRSGVSLTAS